MLEIAELVDWSAVERALDGLHRAARGEAAYPPLMMFKVLLLHRWYVLSDPAMEAALFDRISFLRFVGLSAEDETPDHATIWRFREMLGKAGLMEPLFAELQRQLAARGKLVKQGTLIDASLIAPAARRPPVGEPETGTADPDARFGANNERGRYTFGYKLHVAVDQGSHLVRDLRLTPANVQEVAVGPDLVQGDEAAVYADRGYDAARLLRLQSPALARLYPRMTPSPPSNHPAAIPSRQPQRPKSMHAATFSNPRKGLHPERGASL